jgi:hypothetical protein
MVPRTPRHVCSLIVNVANKRTPRLHPITTDNAGLSVVLPLAGRMADRIDQNPENTANEVPETLGFCCFSHLVR